MLSIGEFARFAGVSVRMLRHYDSLGLLSPSRVDPFSGHRSYDPALLARADALVAFKELGFSLEQVGALLDRGEEPEQLLALLARRRDELRDQLRQDRRRLGEVERRLRMIEGGTMSTLEYVEKPLPALRLVQRTGRVEDVAEIGQRIGPMFEQLYADLGAAGLTPTGPSVAWYAPDGDGMRFAAAAPLTEGALADAEVTDLPAIPRAVTATYRGSMAGIGAAWQELSRHVAESEHEFAGPCREVYLDMPEGDPDGWVTELQQPVA
ncbi:MerR family transcriptional regulator [Nocardioides panacisoli]|uniref:MerR family transcriptional regulator n=1 Tax=Nocardioides panacisoli TaxID=627624 RepID=UPI001C62D253|nr:MerR family transcriptional regulator [Nocardioides panacisoli]QYJ05353.1 MerR family transcriptional regulator [Nocardioides panacisoli]